MKIEVNIVLRRNADGAVRRVVRDWTGTHESWLVCYREDGHTIEDTKDAIESYYREGNGSCDCNRSLWFENAETEGDDTPEDGLAPCGDTAYELLALQVDVL